MSFSTVRQESAGRFAEAQSVLSEIKISARSGEDQQKNNTKKGLFLVLTYAALEYSVTRAVIEAEAQINAVAAQYQHVCGSFCTLALDPELTAVAMAGPASRWQKRLTIFAKQYSQEPLTLHSGTFLSDLQNIWPNTIQTLFKVFAITYAPFYELSVRGHITELTNARNEIAHGRESAADVGRRYTPDRLQIIIEAIILQTQYIHAILEQHINDRDFVQPSHKHLYR